MNIQYTIAIEKRVLNDDIPKLDSTTKARIKKAIQQKLSIDPFSYGKPLRTPLHGYKKLRVGNYRIVFRVEETVVKIFAISHRSKVYGLL